jgi:hypothetical protein
MLRPLAIVLSAAALLGQVFVATVALAGGGGGYGAWGGHFSGGHGVGPAFPGRFGRFAGPGRFFGRFAVPGEFGGYSSGFYDGSFPYGAYPPGQDCVIERVPINTPYGLGWRTFSICPN